MMCWEEWPTEGKAIFCSVVSVYPGGGLVQAPESVRGLGRQALGCEVCSAFVHSWRDHHSTLVLENRKAIIAS